MADNTRINAATTVGDDIATMDVSGVKHEKVIVEHLVGGVPVMTEAANPFPVTDAAALTDTQIRATPLPISGTVAVTGVQTNALTDVQLRATPVPVSGTVAVTGTQTDALTDTQLRATPVPISGTIAAVTAITNALPAGGNNIGDVDVLTLPALAAGTNLIGKVGIDQTTQGTTNKVSLGTDNVNTVEVAPTTIFNGKTTVTTAGTRVALASSQAVKSVTIKSLAANTGIIYVGNATVASSNGFELAPGESVSMDIADLSTVNIDSSVNSQTVAYIAIL